MTESPEEWLERLFEFEFCAECGGDAADHEVGLVLGNYFAWCKQSPSVDTDDEVVTVTLPDGARR